MGCGQTWHKSGKGKITPFAAQRDEGRRLLVQYKARKHNQSAVGLTMFQEMLALRCSCPPG